MAKLILVKHAPPEVTPGVPSPRWVLSQEGWARCAWLAEALRAEAVSRICASLEPKALETAARVAVELGLDVAPRPGLQENDRSGLAFGSVAALHSLIRRFFGAPSEVAMGQESADTALSRFQAAVRRLMGEAPNETVVVVTHGTVLSLLVSRHNAIDPFTLWESLGLPSYVVLDGATLEMICPVHNHP
jgi:broad specificity phosphatase PhoE